MITQLQNMRIKIVLKSIIRSEKKLEALEKLKKYEKERLQKSKKNFSALGKLMTEDQYIKLCKDEGYLK